MHVNNDLLPTINIKAKDMALAVKAATDSQSTVFLGSLAKHVYDSVKHASVATKDGRAESLAGKDFSVVYKWLGGNGEARK